MSIRDWAGLIITTERDILHTLIQLAQFNVAVIQSATMTLGDKKVMGQKDIGEHIVTVSCRRFLRQEKQRKFHNLRQQRYMARKHNDARLTPKRRGDDAQMRPLSQIPIPKSPNPHSQLPSDKPPETEKTTDQEKTSARSATVTVPVSTPTWDAYASAYQARYQVDPVRNAKVNSQLVQLVRHVGGDEAPKLARFYLTHNDSFYVQKRHPVDFLLRDYSGLMTQMRTGHKATRQEAQQAEAGDALREQVTRVQKLLTPGTEAS